MTRDTFDHFQPQDRSMFGENEQRSDDDNDNPLKLAIAVSTASKTPYAQRIWLPRSMIEYVRTGAVRNVTTVRVTLPERLAKEKNLI